MGRTLFIKVGSEEPRGPLAESDVRASLASGVLPSTTMAGPTPSDLRPIHEVLQDLSKERATEQQQRSKGRTKVVLVAVIVLAAIGVAAGVVFYIKTRPPPLCPATPHVLARLQKNMEIRVYVTRKSKKLDSEAKKVEVVLQQMKEVSHKNLDFKVIDVKDEETSKSAKEHGLQEVVIDNNNGAQTQSEDSIDSVTRGYFGVVFLYGSEKDRIPVLASAEGIEFWLDNKIREVSARADGIKKKIGLVATPHGVSISDPEIVPNQTVNMRGIITQYFPYYQIIDVDLSKGGQIGEDIDGLIITAPGDDLSDGDLQAIDDFVMRGKALAIIASAALPARGDARMKVKLDLHGLDRLTAGYGLALGRDLVFDDASAYRIKISTSDGMKDVLFAFMPRITEGHGLDTTSVLFFRIPEVAFPMASSITKDEAKQPGARFRVLARSSGSAVRDTRAEIEVLPSSLKSKGEGQAGEVILAATVDGNLKSALGSGGASGTSSKKPARVGVIASSLFLTNPFTRAAAPPGPPSAGFKDGMGMMPPPVAGDETLTQLASPYVQTFGTSAILILKNLLDWVTFDDDMADCLEIKPADEKKKK